MDANTKVIPAEKSAESPFQPAREVAVQGGSNIDAMIAIAFDKGYDLDRIDRLLEMQRQWKAEQAREAFFAAEAEWKKNPIEVIKDKKNTHYGNQYSSIGNQVNPVNASMAPFGLSTDWDIDQSDPQRIKVTCIMKHKLGHSKSVTLSGPPDTSGSKNALQQIKSTLTYLELATHQAVTGVVASDAANLDDDGNAAGIKTITGAQVSTIRKHIKETKTAEKVFLDWIAAETLEAIPETDFNRAMAELNRKKRVLAAREAQS